MKYLTLTGLLLISFWGYNQKKDTLTTSYNAKNKQIQELSSHQIKFKKDLKIQVDSIQPALHKVVFEFKDFIWYSEAPEAIAEILPGINELVSIPNPKTIMEGHSNSTTNLIKTPISFRLDSIHQVINQTKDTLMKTGKPNTAILKNAFNTIATYLKYELPDTNHVTGKSILTTLSYQIDSLENAYQIELDHIKLKGLPDKYSSATLQHLAYVKTQHQKLQKIKPQILNGTKAIVYGLKKTKTSATSKLHLPKKEAVVVDIHVIDRFSPKDTLATLSSDIYGTGNFKLDFSVGIGGNSLIDPVFYIGRKDSIPFIAQEDKRKIDLTAYSLLHFNWRLKSCLSVGPLTGVSVSIIDAKPSYLLGAGITIGKAKTISFSGGASFGELKLLSNEISSDGYHVDQPLDPDISTVPTYKKMSVGYFFALTYNFGRVKKY